MSTFSATRSIVFAGDRVIVAAETGTRRIEGTQVPAEVYQVLSLDVSSGVIKAKREFLAFGSLGLFGTEDGKVIVAGRTLTKIDADLQDLIRFDMSEAKYGAVENISPDGSTLDDDTSPGMSLIDSQTLKANLFSRNPGAATSVNRNGYVTDDVHWIGDFPNDADFVTYYDSSGDHLLYHGKCGGRPQFLTNELILEPGCDKPIIIDIQGHVVRTIDVKRPFSYAGVSRNGKYFALQFGSASEERFIVFSIESGNPVTELKADLMPEGQSWTAFSPDGSMFIVGSPLRLTLYRLP